MISFSPDKGENDLKIKDIISVLCFTIGMCLIWSVALHSAAGVGVGLCFGAAFGISTGLFARGRKKTDSENKKDEVVK